MQAIISSKFKTDATPTFDATEVTTLSSSWIFLHLFSITSIKYIIPLVHTSVLGTLCLSTLFSFQASHMMQSNNARTSASSDPLYSDDSFPFYFHSHLNNQESGSSIGHGDDVLAATQSQHYPMSLGDTPYMQQWNINAPCELSVKLPALVLPHITNSLVARHKFHKCKTRKLPGTLFPRKCSNTGLRVLCRILFRRANQSCQITKLP